MALDPVTAGIEAISAIIDKVFPDATKAAEIKAQIVSAKEDNDVRLALAQISVNAIEAGSTNWVVAGWRPFVAWVCALAVFYDTIVFSSLSTFFPLKEITPATFAMAFGLLTTLIGARSFDKFNGTDTK